MNQHPLASDTIRKEGEREFIRRRIKPDANPRLTREQVSEVDPSTQMRTPAIRNGMVAFRRESTTTWQIPTH